MALDPFSNQGWLPMRSVDTHFHIWDLQENYYPWLTDKVQPRVIGDYAAIRKTTSSATSSPTLPARVS